MTLRLIHGDCIEQMKLLPDKSVDLFVCDLPYGQLTTPKIGGQANVRFSNERCSWDVKIDLAAFWIEVERLARNDHTPVLHFCNTRFGIELINSKPDWFRYDLVWNKERGVSFLLANKMPMKSHEMIYVFCKKGSFYNRVDIKGDYKSWKASESTSSTRIVKVAGGVCKATANDGTTRCALSVINIRKPNTIGHPTEKPIELYKWLIERYCPENGTVLDATAGSFNSVQAAQQLGRNGIGIEKDEGFFNAARDRLEPRNEIIPAPVEDAV